MVWDYSATGEAAGPLRVIGSSSPLTQRILLFPNQYWFVQSHYVLWQGCDNFLKNVSTGINQYLGFVDVKPSIAIMYQKLKNNADDGRYLFRLSATIILGAKTHFFHVVSIPSSVQYLTSELLKIFVLKREFEFWYMWRYKCRFECMELSASFLVSLWKVAMVQKDK